MMKLSIINDEIGPSLEDSIKFLKENNLKYLELRSINKKNIVDMSFEECEKIMLLLKKNRITVSGIASPLFKCSLGLRENSQNHDSFFVKGEKYLDSNEILLKLIKISNIFECNNIRIFSFLKMEDIPISKVWSDIIIKLKSAVKLAEQNNKILLLENEPSCYIESIEEVLKCVREINSKHLKILLDPGNLYIRGKELKNEDLNLLNEYLGYVHVKDVLVTDKTRTYSNVGFGSINYKRIISKLGSFYTGFISLETHVSGDPYSNSKISINHLKNFLSNKVVRYALVGCGRISRKHFDAFSKDQYSSLYAIHDTNQAKAIGSAKSYDCSNLTFKEILSNPDIDIVDICTPSYLHKDMCIQVLLSGKNALVEKPLALSSRDIKEIIRYESKTKKKVFVVHQNRFNQPIVSLMAALKKKEIGKLLISNVSLRWYRDDSYYLDWHGKLSLDGGTLLNQAIHHIDLLRIFCGGIKKANGFRARLMHNIEIEDAFVGTILFKAGVLSTVEVSTCCFPENTEASITLMGSKGIIKIGGIALNKVDIWKTAKKNIVSNENSKSQDYYGNSHVILISNVSKNLLGHKSEIIDSKEALKTLEFIEQLYKSSTFIK